MELLPCNRPEGSLEPAPRTSLRADSAHGALEGFWCLADERYYARDIRDDGGEQWYRIGDPGEESARRVHRASYMSVRRASRVSYITRETPTTRRATPFSKYDAPRTLMHNARRTVLLVVRVNGRSILVGSRRRGGVR